MDARAVEVRDGPTAAYLAEDRSGVLVGIAISMAALTTAILGLRFYAKRFQGGGFFADDAFTVASYIVNLGMCAVGIREFSLLLLFPRPGGGGDGFGWSSSLLPTC